MSGICETAWLTNPYVVWRHPMARIAAVMLFVLLDICVYGTDPIAESRVEGNIPGIGIIYSFLFRLPPDAGKLLARLGLIVLCCSCGLYVGRQWLHHRLLRDACALSMFDGSNGSFLLMGLGVGSACLAGAAIYNWMVPEKVMQATGATAMEARTFGKLLHILSAVAHSLAAVQVTDEVLQDRQRYPSFAIGLKRHWRLLKGGWLRILCAWAMAVALVGAICLSLQSGTWGALDETSRVFFASVLVFFDILVVVQDWEFPTLQSHPNLERPLLIAGTFRPDLRCTAGSHLQHLSQGRVGKRSLLPSPTGLSRTGADKFFNVTISRPWLTYGPLFCAVCLDVLTVLQQMLYTPEDFGQYVDPSTNRIWTIVDNQYLASAYESGILQKGGSELVSWAARRNTSTGLPLNVSAASDVLSTARFSDADVFWKVAASMPGFVMLLAFLPLIVVADRLGRSPDNRPPLLEPEPDPEVAAPPMKVFRFAAKDSAKPLPPPASPAPPEVPTELPPPWLAELTEPEHDAVVESEIFRMKSPDALEEKLRSEVPSQEVDLEAAAQERAQAPAPPRIPAELCDNGAKSSNGTLGEDGTASEVTMNEVVRHGRCETPKTVSFSDNVEDVAINTPFTNLSPIRLASPAGLKTPPGFGMTTEGGCDLSGLATVNGKSMTAELNRMSSTELQKRAKLQRKRMKEAGHFDVLLRKEGRSLGLTFKLPEAVSRKTHSTKVQEALLQESQLRVPDGTKPLNFGRYKGMPMRDVAVNFPRFCQSILQEEQDAAYPNGDILCFVMYLRMAHPELNSEPLEMVQEMSACTKADGTTLLVVDIAEKCVVDEYNRAQAAVGNWSKIVLPGMYISSVNGIRQDSLAMATALCRAEVATIRFLFLRSFEVAGIYSMSMPLQVSDQTQRLLEERISKLVRVEREEIRNSMRTQEDWEAMSANLASALVKEVYKGGRLLGETLAPRTALPTKPEELPQDLSRTNLGALPSNGHTTGLSWVDGAELSDSEESV